MFYILYFIFFPATLQPSTVNHATLQLSPKLFLLPFKGGFKKGLQVAALVKIKLLLGLTH
jgi:hypothetical protein